MFTPRSGTMGNPRYYSCFTDESLNHVLRTVVQHAHPRKLEVRVFRMMHLRGVMRLDKYFFAAGELA